jgi:hypothetical protein
MKARIIQARNAFRKRRRLQQSKEAGFLLGVRCGANVSQALIKSAWTDLEKLPTEVFRRVRGN